MKNSVTIFSIITAIAVINIAAYAAPPKTITYQGYLTDINTGPVADSQYMATFSIYKSNAGGLVYWSETKSIGTIDGFFSTELGDVVPLSNLSFREELWLGIRLQGGQEFSPRSRLTAVPYSFHSLNSDTSDYARYGGIISRPISPPVSKSEISGKTVVRSISVYPVAMSDSVSIMQDSIFLIAGTNISLKQNGDSIIIHSVISSDSAGGTLDFAYDYGGPGKGRNIKADAGSVEITGDDGLSVSGSKNALSVQTSADISAISAKHDGGGGNAIFAELTQNNSPFAALRAESIGDESSSSVYGIARGQGLAGFFEVQNTASKSPALMVGGLGLGSALKGYIYNKESPLALLEILNKDNPNPVVKAVNNGPGYGGLFVSQEHPPILPSVSGIAGVSTKYIGVYGYSRDSTGVYGGMNKAGTYALTQNVTAGVVGESGNVSTADNFGVAGVAAGYGTGVIGIGSGAGHGVYGVSGNNSKYTSAGVRGITREDSIGQFIGWPPYIPLEEYIPYNKNRVGVLGQAVWRVGVWGESFHRFGVVGNTGQNIGWDDLPGDSAGILGLAYQNNGTAVLGISKRGKAGKFQIKEQTNQNPALWVETSGIGEAAYFWAKYSMNFDPAVYIDNGGMGSALFMQNTNTQNNTPALHISNNGLGRAAEIDIQNTASQGTGLYVTTAGTGRAGEVSILSTVSPASAFYIDTRGLGRVLNLKTDNAANDSNVFYASTIGRGRVGEFNIFNASNPSPSLYVSTNGTGNAAYFRSFSASNPSPAVVVQTTSGSNYALVVYGAGSPPRAASFSGNVDVFGNLSKTSGNFRIDHPLDPENKYLNHSFVESPDMKNIYDGIAILDGSGQAEVLLPEWFGALNIDIRYQLTPVGAPAPGLYIAEEVNNNRFRIAGGKPGQKISWQLTGTRNDVYARENRMQVEVMKNNDEKGKLLYQGKHSSNDDLMPESPNSITGSFTK